MRTLNYLLKLFFFGIIVKPLVLVVIGLNIRRFAHLPVVGPAVIAANHNSHLDTLVLMSLYPLKDIHRVRPVAAADYFLKNGFLAWFALDIIGIIPLKRSGYSRPDTLFSACHKALDKGHILLIFPEGSRGEPEKMGQVKKGIYYLVKERDATPIYPVVLHGLGRSLPKGEGLLVPYNCDVIIGNPICEVTSADGLRDALVKEYAELAEYCITKHAE